MYTLFKYIIYIYRETTIPFTPSRKKEKTKADLHQDVFYATVTPTWAVHKNASLV